MDAVEWLLEQIADDERVAQATVALPRWVATEDAEVYEVYGDLSSPQRCSEHPLGVPNMCDDLKVAEGSDVTDTLGAERASHIARWDPARVLAECAAKRAIVEQRRTALAEQAAALHADWLDPAQQTAAITAAEEMEKVVRLLAQPYAGREGFPPEMALTE